MTISIECTKCRKKLKAPAQAVGRRIKCPACQEVQTVVGSPAEPADGEVSFEEPSVASSVAPNLDDPFGGEVFSSDDMEDPQARKRRIAEKRVQRERERARAEEEAEEEAEQKRTKKVKVRAESARAEADLGQPFRYHWIYLIALVPLALSILWPNEPASLRLSRTLENHPEVASQLEGEGDDPLDFFELLPGHRIEGALLARDSLVHWFFGAISAGAYLGLLFAMFPGTHKRTIRLLLVGLFTATIGIAILLLFQVLASATGGLYVQGRGLGILIFLIFKLIGFSYRCALDPSIGFWGSFFGFTIGVGLCEELCKAVPVRHYLRNHRKTGWRGACLTGLASGIGFGVSEGIMYSGSMYNGLSEGLTYLVRFVSCVSLHATWSGSVALMMYRNQDFLDTDDWMEFLAGMGYYLSIAMMLHGMYDTLLKHDLHIVAILIGIGSYLWLAYLVRISRGT